MLHVVLCCCEGGVRAARGLARAHTRANSRRARAERIVTPPSTPPTGAEGAPPAICSTRPVLSRHGSARFQPIQGASSGGDAPSQASATQATTIPPVLAMCAVCLPRASPPLSCSALRVRTLRRGDSQLAQFAGRRQDTRCAPNWSEHLEWPPPHSRSKTRRWARSNKAHPMPGLQAPAPSLLQVTRINPLTRHFDSTLSLDTLVGSTTL